MNLNLLRKVVSTLAFVLLGHGASHAGLVSGRWDPQFGPALPNLSWQVRADWLVPNGCSNANPPHGGVFSTTDPGGPCESTLSEPVRLLGLWVRWFDTDAGDPNDFFQHVSPISAHAGWCESVFALGNPDCAVNMTIFSQGSEPLLASDIRVEQQQVVGFNTTPTVFLYTFGGWPVSAGINTYSLSFTTNGPIFTCTTCDPVALADNTTLDQFLVTYTSDDTTNPKFKDANGNALGAVLDGTGKYLGQRAVPEPGTISLVLAALMAGSIAARRRGC